MAFNFAVESGGGLFGTGAVEIENTVFAENMAKDGGLAIQDTSMESAVELLNVTFDGNVLGCPPHLYSFTKDVSMAVERPLSIWIFAQNV